MIITICKDFEFESAQALPQFPEGHKCRKIHGHSFKVTIAVRGPVDEASGIFYDHAVISDAMRPIVAQLDHAFLNDIPGLENPTIELMARWFWDKLHAQLPGLYEITLHETPPREVRVSRGVIGILTELRKADGMNGIPEIDSVPGDPGPSYPPVRGAQFGLPRFQITN